MDKNKQAALAKALEQIERGAAASSNLIRVKMQGESELPPDGLREELEATLGGSVSITWQQVTKRDIPRTNNWEITDGVSAEQRYYEEAARRGARTGD